MIKLILILTLSIFSQFSFGKSDFCFKGKIEMDEVDKICFDKEQVEHHYVISAKPDKPMIEVKILNVPTPFVIYADADWFQSKIN